MCSPITQQISTYLCEFKRVDKVREVALTTSIIGKGIGKTLPNVYRKKRIIFFGSFLIYLIVLIPIGKWLK